MKQNFFDRFVSSTAWMVFAFMYLPLVLMIFYSFNDSSVASFPIQVFSTKWYRLMFQNEALIQAVKNSFYIAILSTTMAVAIGVPAAYALSKLKFYGDKLIERIVLMPITLPGIVTGVAMLSFFPLLQINISLKAVIIGHTTFLLSIVITQMVARFKSLDPLLEQAAFDLGASPTIVFFKVVLPNVKTSLIGAVFLCLVLSMDEIPVTYFLTAVDNTLPIEIYGIMRRGITPEINVVSTLVFIFSSISILIAVKLSDGNTTFKIN